MDRTLLNNLWHIADEIIRPRAASADQGDLGGLVKDNIRVLASKGYLGIGVPREYCGLGADEVTQHEYTEIIAASCGVTAFTQQQLRTGIRYIVDYASPELKARLLPELAAGRILCGIALSQLRRSGDPILNARPVDGGYRIDGLIPWISGWSILDSFVVGVPIENAAKHILAYVDLHENHSKMTASAPLDLVAMRASGTVSVEVEDLFVPSDYVLAVRPNEEIHKSDDREITMHTALPLGCARAAERHLRDFAKQRAREEIDQIATALMFEITHCRREALTWNCECVAHPDYKTNALRARASAIVLAMRAAHAAVAATGGASQLMTAAPQRLLREAQFYTTAVLTPDVQASVLDQLFSPFYGM
jgi:alkylation response protein AidB-like acyl-CoA dehydrogenase